MTTAPHAGMATAVGRTIRERRLGRGLGRTELARQSGLSVSYVGLVESGARFPTLFTLFRIATVLDCQIADLVYPLETQRSA